jgi:hypothetical protein
MIYPLSVAFLFGESMGLGALLWVVAEIHVVGCHTMKHAKHSCSIYLILCPSICALPVYMISNRKAMG